MYSERIVNLQHVNTFVTIYSNRFDMSARPLRDFFPYYAKLAYKQNDGVMEKTDFHPRLFPTFAILKRMDFEFIFIKTKFNQRLY